MQQKLLEGICGFTRELWERVHRLARFPTGFQRASSSVIELHPEEPNPSDRW
jgi:hypothetical protein